MHHPSSVPQPLGDRESISFNYLSQRSTIPNTKSKGLVELTRNEINGLQHVNAQREPYLLYLGAPVTLLLREPPNGRTEDLAFSDDSLKHTCT